MYSTVGSKPCSALIVHLLQRTTRMYLLRHRVARTAAPNKQSLVLNHSDQLYVERTGGDCNSSCNDISTKLVRFELTEGKEGCSWSAFLAGQWFNVGPGQLPG